jgi:thioredoxin-related protein
MFKITKLILLVVTASLVFSSGCKDEPAPVEPVETPPIKIVPLEPVKPVEPVVSAPVEEPKLEEPVVSDVDDNDEPKTVADDLWMTDYAAAVKKAAAEKKGMLIDFTGSDWCMWCIKLDEEVFSQKEFIDAASEDFVFVKLDFPKDESKIALRLQAQNAKLQLKFGVENFPSIFITDVQGRPYAQTGYQPGGPAAYLTHLSKLREVKVKYDELMVKADSAELGDVDKARLVDEAVRLLPAGPVFGFYRPEVERIIALDSGNDAKLRDRHRSNLLLSDASELLKAGEYEKAVSLVDKALTDTKMQGEIVQEIYYFRAWVVDSKGDKAGTIESLKKAIEAAPETETADIIRGVIKSYLPEAAPKKAPK